MSRHVLSPKPAYAAYHIVVGWDRPLGTYYAQVLHHRADESDEPSRFAIITAALHWLAALLPLPARQRPAEPAFIWLGADDIPIVHATEVIEAVAPYALIPETLPLVLALDQLTEGSRRFRP